MTYQYNAQVVRWVDGDTVELDVDLGFHLRFKDHFRLLGVDTAERGKPLAAEAKALSISLAPAGASVRINTTKGDKYGRYLTDVVTAAGENVAGQLLKAGLANPYWGGTKIDSLDAGKIAIGSITSDKIAAKSITPDTLIL